MFIAREDFGFISGICKHFVVRLREARAGNQLKLLKMKQGKNFLFSIARVIKACLGVRKTWHEDNAYAPNLNIL